MMILVTMICGEIRAKKAGAKSENAGGFMGVGIRAGMHVFPCAEPYPVAKVPAIEANTAKPCFCEKNSPVKSTPGPEKKKPGQSAQSQRVQDNGKTSRPCSAAHTRGENIAQNGHKCRYNAFCDFTRVVTLVNF